MSKLTNRAVNALRPSNKDTIYWDDDLPCFGVRVKPSGQRSYVIQYRVKGRTRRLTLGAVGTLTPDQARREARKQLGRVDLGEDPAELRRQERLGKTMADFCKRYLDDHAVLRKKTRSADEDRRMIDSFILPALGNRKVADVNRQDVTRLHLSLKRTPYQANRVLACLSKMMNLAERWGVRPDNTNPCRHVERFKEDRRQRFLSAEELGRLGDALRAVEAEQVVLTSVGPAIRLLLLTGARLNEILTLKWEYVDWERQCLHLPESKTGAKDIRLSPTRSRCP